ncbi:PepSY domain-containing protein [Pedobacter sp. SYSU D00535]|uniref:PepSY-associated TM helix domain-containing protein n=1 Tax=Pedobacter sp. SYSU D00535 TaxID=2810308 RepID=UPI001A95B3C4|nr:PepSY-associated TM helix domain-containing protein [Pedobacter sp. SYSU D00535]
MAATSPSNPKKKKISSFLHLWLGLASGLVVFIVAVTGCLYVFHKEISQVADRETLYIEPPAAGSSLLPIGELKERAEKALQQKVYSITTYRDQQHAWEFMVFEPGDKEALWFFDTVKAYKSAFLNPYTGELTGLKDYKQDFFIIVKYLHWSLLLNTKYGQPIVGYATLIFVVLLITGLILWWPRNWNRHNLRKSFSINWRASFKRLNYDLHNVPGFYAMLILLILALTGMNWAMKWFQTAVYVVASQSVTPPVKKVYSSDSTAVPVKDPLQAAYLQALSRFPDAKRIALSPAKDASGAISATGYYGTETYYDADVLKLDQYSGKLLGRENFSDKNNGEKIIKMNYDIHVGAVWGLTGKIIAFIASLIAASLPVTGFIIWWGRRKKARKAARLPRKRRQGGNGVVIRE